MYKAIRRNKRNTVILIAVFVLLFGLVASPLFYSAYTSYEEANALEAKIQVYSKQVSVAQNAYLEAQREPSSSGPSGTLAADQYKAKQQLDTAQKNLAKAKRYLLSYQDQMRDSMITGAGIIIFALLYAWFQYFMSMKFALSATGSRPIALDTTDPDELRILQTVHSLSIGEGFKKDPDCYIIDDMSPNAFATGRDPDHSSVSVTRGLLAIMDDRELRAVIGHEVSHIKNYDIRVSMIVFGLVCAVALLCDLLRNLGYVQMRGSRNSRDNNAGAILFIVGIVASIILPFIAAIIQLAVSRQREYLADQSSADLTKDPDGMISALKKLMDPDLPAMARQNTATAHLFFNMPLSGGSFSSRMFSTHPPLEERIRRLMESRYRFNESNKVTDQQLQAELSK